MIEKKDITALPFVDGVPDPTARPDQARIDWIKNGNCLDAAKTETSNEGSLNRTGVSIQKNVTQVQSNVVEVKKSLDETIDQVNKHCEILDQADDLDLIQTVQKHTEEIETLNFAVTQNSERFDELADKVQKNTDEIGVVPSHDTSDRNIRTELEWQKTEMGAYPGFDYNGRPDIDSRGSGMKYRIINNSMAISEHTARLNELESDWASSDVGSLTREVQAIRTEVGPARDKLPGKTIYERLNRAEGKNDANTTDITKIKEHTGINSFPRPGNLTLIDLVDTTTGNLNDLAESLRDTNARLLVVESEIGDESDPDTILYNQKVTMKDVKDLYEIVGKNNSEGLRYSVAILETELGADNTPGTVKNRILLTEQGIRDLNMSIDSINDALGITSGASGSFSDRVTELELQMNGDENGDTEYEKIGVYPYAYKLFTDGVVSDVKDSNIYVRTKDAWVELGITDIDVRSSLKVNGSVFLQQDSDGIHLGTQDDIILEGRLSNVKVVNGIKLHDVSNTIEIERDGIQAIDEKIVVGDAAAITDIKGTSVLINGRDVTDSVTEAPKDNETYIRKDGQWTKTDSQPVKISTLKDSKDSNILVVDTELTFGSDTKESIFKNVQKIQTKNLEIVDEVGDIVLKDEEGRLTLASKSIYSGTNKVITTADDAPNDNDYYARYKGTWAKIDPNGEGTGGGIEDVPNNDLQYIRSGQAWVQLGSTPINMTDDIAIQWKSGANNFAGMRYSDITKKLTVGGSGTKVEIEGDVSKLSLDETMSLTKKLGTSNASVIMSDSDQNLIIGDPLYKEIVLRSKEDPSVVTTDGKFKLWHSGQDAKQDGQTYGRKDGSWVPFVVNRTQDVILNNGFSFKVVDTKNKMLSVATSGADNLVELGQAGALMNIRSTVRLLNLDNKVHLTSYDGSTRINLVGRTDERILVGDPTRKLNLEGSELTMNGKKVVTSADDAPNDGTKYVRQDNKWEKAYSYGEDAPSAVGAKNGDIYFQYM